MDDVRALVGVLCANNRRSSAAPAPSLVRSACVVLGYFAARGAAYQTAVGLCEWAQLSAAQLAAAAELGYTESTWHSNDVLLELLPAAAAAAAAAAAPTPARPDAGAGAGAGMSITLRGGAAAGGGAGRLCWSASEGAGAMAQAWRALPDETRRAATLLGPVLAYEYPPEH